VKSRSVTERVVVNDCVLVFVGGGHSVCAPGYKLVPSENAHLGKLTVRTEMANTFFPAIFKMPMWKAEDMLRYHDAQILQRSTGGGTSAIEYIPANAHNLRTANVDTLVIYLKDSYVQLRHDQKQRVSIWQKSKGENGVLDEWLRVNPEGAFFHGRTELTRIYTPVKNDLLQYIRWKKKSNDWNLLNKQGRYKFDASRYTITVTDLTRATESQLVMEKAGVTGDSFARYTGRLEDIGIQNINSAIQIEVQKVQSESDRLKIFVLPSQLNGAEYPSPDTIVEDVSDYLHDKTGGPRGQLSADPGVAQFIIDNASNQHANDGINNVSRMGNIPGIRLENGYLMVSSEELNIQQFSNQLKEMTLLGVQNVAVKGLDTSYSNFVDRAHTVDLLYASAVPVGVYGNTNDVKTQMVAKLTLYAQYVAAMRIAVNRGNCDLVLMPLGGGVFNNQAMDIKSAIYSAFVQMRSYLSFANVEVKVLTYDNNHAEKKTYR